MRVEKAGHEREPAAIDDGSRLRQTVATKDANLPTIETDAARECGSAGSVNDITILN
ncbi:hypothetical protein SDC9_98208 [bioreactor metagenome]|uniref:Uncharacterized protein n=1 Tax=bioreactor metagenome TaxID=1076179 RepID=A0A645AE52_9ZZZZ